MKTHKELDVWRLSIEFVTKIYKLTRCSPDDEKFGLTSQLRRAAVSIPSNLSEGFARKGQKETVHFLYLALGSHSEIETQLIIARNLNYIDLKQFDLLENQNSRIGQMLVKLIQRLK